MKGNQRKNEKGFTLVELIVVIAIISVVTGAIALSINFLTNSRVKKAYNILMESYSEARLNSMSKTTATNLTLSYSGGKYYIEIGNEGKEEILSSPYTISYTLSNGTVVTLNDQNPTLVISFKRATGGLKPQGSNLYVEKIDVAGKVIEIVPDSGKYREL